MNRKRSSNSQAVAPDQPKSQPLNPPVPRRIDPAVRRYLGNVKGHLIALV